MSRLTGWRYAAFIGAFLTAAGIQCYFVILTPLINPEPYKLIREETQSQLQKREI